MTIIIAYNMAVSQMKSPKIVDIYGLPGHCFVRVDSGKQCKLTKFCKSLLVGSAPKPLKTRACALWLCRIPASFDLLAAPEIQKRKAPVPVMLL